MQMPLVDQHDDGIRPAGPHDECFYCRSKVGHPHGPECVVVHKKMRVRYVFDIEIEVPYFWDKENVEFHRNDSSWCASNALDDIAKFSRRDEPDLEPDDTGCLCPNFHCEYLGEDDNQVPYIEKGNPDDARYQPRNAPNTLNTDQRFYSI